MAQTVRNDLRNIAAVRSEIGMVFQQFNLFPHLTVLQNVTLGPIRVRKLPKAQADASALRLLERGRSVLVFPEDSRSPANEVLCDFRTGFIHLARAYWHRTRRIISFLPVAVHPGAQAIRIGPPIPFDAQAPFALEKQRVKRALESSIYRLYRDLERERTAWSSASCP